MMTMNRKEVKGMPKKIKITGVIVPNDSKWIYDLFGYESTCPKDVEDIINSIDPSDEDKDLDVTINSGGGNVFAGSEIYTLLKAHKGKVVGTIVGVAASAASVIGMGCDILRITPTAQIMIHNVSSCTCGDYRDMQHSAEFLKGWNKSIANSYILKTGLSQDKLLQLMNKETWMTAPEALQYKFVDEVLFDTQNQLAASMGTSAGELIPDKIIAKMREFLSKEGSIPNMGGYKLNPLFNQKGVEPMNFEEFLNSLPEEQRKLVQDAIDAAKATATAEAEAAANEKLQAETARADELQNTVNELQKQLDENSASNDGEEDILATADPRLVAMIEESRKKEKEALAALKQAKDKEELGTFQASIGKLDKLPINAAEMAPIFRTFANTDQEGYDKLFALLTAVNNGIEAGALFNTNGTKITTDKSAWDQIQDLVKAAMSEDKSLTEPIAFRQVIRDNRDLYNKYLDERNEASSYGSEE